MRCHLILNPKSNSGRAAKKFDAISGLMNNAGVEFTCTYAQTYSSILNAAVEAHSGDHDAIVAVGGDGTINAVMNSFYTKEGTLRSDKMMGVIYTGTSPDFCLSYGIPLDLEGAVEILKHQAVRKVRVGRIEFSKNPDAFEAEVRYFSCCASIGIGAMVASKANRIRKYFGDAAGTFAAILSALAKFHPYDTTVRTMNEQTEFTRVTNIFIGRTKYIASGLKFREGMADEDTRFYVICVRNLNLRRLPGLLKQLYSGKAASSTALKVFFSEDIHMETDKAGIAVEFDGDPAGFMPCHIQASPYPLKLITGS